MGLIAINFAYVGYQKAETFRFYQRILRGFQGSCCSCSFLTSEKRLETQKKVGGVGAGPYWLKFRAIESILVVNDPGRLIDSCWSSGQRRIRRRRRGN